MKNRKLFVILAAMLSLFVVAGIASAQDQVAVNVTSEPIQQHASCDKAGGFSLAFDSNTSLVVGDVITIDLDFGVVLCRAIDLEISDGGNAGLWTAANVMTNTNDDPIYYVDDATTAGDLAQTGAGIYFRLQGNQGSARMTLTVRGTAGDRLTVGADPGDELILKFLDQNTNADFTNPGLYKDINKDGSYGDAAELADNTMCIDISNPSFTANVVLAHMDSSLDKFTFIPSNPEIAHVISPHAYQFAICKGRECGEILLGSKTSSQSGGSESCIAFDNELGFDPYCTEGIYHHTENRIVIERTDANFDTDDYELEVTILVNGASGDHGVYFSNSGVAVSTATNNTAACAFDDEDGDTALTETYYKADGTLATAVAVPNFLECDVAANARAVKLTTAANSMGLTGAEDFLYVNLPPFNYDLDDVNDGDVVSVEIKLIKAPCGELFTGEWCIGTLVDSCSVTVEAPSSQLLFPYYTNMSGDQWWDGIVVDNLTSSAGTFTAYIYEQDGDQGTFTSPVVAANSSYIALLSNIAGSVVPTVTTGSGVIGDSACYILVCTNFAVTDGFAMIGSSLDSAVNGSETMGYLPRTTAADMCP